MGTLIQTFPDGGSGGGASAGMIADEFSISVDYAVGDLVIYDKTLYKFTSAHSAGAWDPSDVTDDVTVDSELKLKQNLSDTFNGTLQQWEALPLATKLTYKYANITNDPTEQLEIVSADIDIENHIVHLDGDELVGLNGIWKTQGEYGVKNLIPYPYVTGSKTQNDVTFTINSDGSVSLSGTATADASLVLMSVEDDTYSGYKMSGGHSNTIYMRQRITDKSGTFVRSTQDYGDGAVLDSINPSTEKYTIMIWVANGAVTDGITIYPMLRSANDTDKTYRPYAKTNKQLTDEISGNTSDIDEIDERLDNTTTAVTGNPISIPGLKSNQLAKDPIITFEPIQAGSGDPSPSNVRAISGYDKIEVLSCGKNLLNPESLRQGDWQSSAMNHDIRVSNDFSYSPISEIGKTYTISFTPSSACKYIYVYITDESNTLQNIAGPVNTNVTFTALVNGHIRVIFGNEYTSSGWENIYVNDVIASNPQIEEGQTATTYEPYHKTTDLSLTLGQTIYGGTLDVETGVLTVDRAGVDLGNLNYTYNSDSAYFLSTNLTDIAPASISWRHNNITCSCYKQATDWSDLSGNTGINNIIDADDMQVILRDTRYTDATSFKTAIAGQTLVYKLATPFTIQLTPHEISLLKDYAYVSTNGTNISLDYHNGELASLADIAQLGQTVNELGDKVTECSVSVLADGVKTYSQLLDELFSLIDISKVTYNSKFIDINLNQPNQYNSFVLGGISTTAYVFFKVFMIPSYCYMYSINIYPSSSQYIFYENGTVINQSTNVPVANKLLKFIY